MTVLREQDFDKLATRAVDAFLSGKSGLADAAAAEAKEAGLNPDQIERLTQSANTMTFLRMMDDRRAKGASDLTHEFDPIDAKQVIKIVIDNTGVHIHPGNVPVETAGESDELPDEMSETRGKVPMPPAPEHHATEDEDAPKAPPPGSKAAADLVMCRRKLATILDDQFHQAGWAFEDAYKALTARFKRANAASFAEFEKDALAEHGDAVGVQVLNLIRDTRGLAALDVKSANEKTAALQGFHISDDTVELKMFEQLVKIAADAARIRRGLEHVRGLCA